MKSWTPDASEYFENWLGRVQVSLRGDPRVDPDDIAEDLRAHVHAELGAAPEPVTVTELSRVLDSLGTPEIWSETPGAAAGRTGDWFHRHVGQVFAEGQKRLASGLALPLILVALTALALPLLGSGPSGVFLLAVAFVIARAHVVHAPHQVTGRRRWAFYLPLAIGIGTLAGVVLAFPLILQGRGGDAWPRMLMLGAWWVVVGLVTGREPRHVRAVLRPFADTFDPSHARVLMLLGVALFIAAAVLMLANG